MTKNKKTILVLVVSIIILLALLIWRSDLHLLFPPTPPTALEKAVNYPAATSANNSIASTTPDKQEQIKVVAENLNIPWEMIFLPDGSFLITERPGNLVRLNINSNATPIKIPVASVKTDGEGGLLGMVLHPDFAQNNWLYLYFTTAGAKGNINKVERFIFDDKANSLTPDKEIVSNIPAGANHDGGRIAFGPDGYLYITTGESGQANLAQDKNSLGGKILRVKDDGSIPADNPFGNAVYSYGNRNSEGIAWDSSEQLWATEHGPSGALTGFDEINLIVKGGNYGWPIVYGQTNKPGLIAPIIQSGATDTWAPSGNLIIGNTLLWAGLRGEAIYSATINGKKLENFKTTFKNQFGRLRFIKQAPDGWLYIATNNTDGRGTPKPGDDKLIRIDPKLLIK